MSTGVAELQELLNLDASTASGPEAATGVLDMGVYVRGLESALVSHSREGSYASAYKLAKAVIHSALDAASDDTWVMISNSWGKDSTTMLGVYCEVLLERRDAGLRTLPTMVITADTGSEFIDMQKRTDEENVRLSAWARKHGFVIECHVVRPPAKDGLLANLIGAGRPLPKYSNSRTAGASEWCVDRVKVGPINRALDLAKGRATKLLHFLGVRTEESSRRSATIARHSNGMPFGLARVTLARRRGGMVVNEGDATRVGVQPIVHWTHEDLTTFLRVNMAPWNAFSYESLKEIYKRAAGPDDINGAGECRITLTKDGGVSNTCSDLSGSRMGCLLCVKSSNQSLKNIAEKDRSYRWIRAAHRFIYSGIRQHQLRMKDIKAAGWNRETLFPKTYLFSWRVRLLALIYRAEIEGGHTLITQDTERAITQWWHRSGVFTVRPMDIRKDVERWIATGRLTFAHEADAANYEDLSIGLSEGIPGGIYAHALYPDAFKQPIEMINLMAMAGRGNGFYPSLRAYVFRDLSSRGGFLTLLTDTPSDMGRRLNTDALNGFEGFALELIGTRELSQLERSLLRGRTIFYRHRVGELEQRIERMSGAKWLPGSPLSHPIAGMLADTILLNLNLHDPCGEHAYADHVFEGMFISRLRGKLTGIELDEIDAKVRRAAEMGDILSDRHERSRVLVLRRHRELLNRLGSDIMNAGDKAARDTVKKAIEEDWRPQDTVDLYLGYVEAVRELAELVRAGKANTELINRLAFINRDERFDPEHAHSLRMDLARIFFPEVGQAIPKNHAAAFAA